MILCVHGELEYPWGSVVCLEPRITICMHYNHKGRRIIINFFTFVTSTVSIFYLNLCGCTPYYSQVCAESCRLMLVLLPKSNEVMKCLRYKPNSIALSIENEERLLEWVLKCR